MTNRFRFRAWLPTLKEIRYFELFSCADADSINDYNAVVSSLTEKAKIMQSTGLADRSGKEIFEGDILANNGYIEGSVEYGKQSCGCCVYVYGFMCGEGTGISLSDAKDYYAIIGNIYEHPHLLSPSAK